MNQNIALTIAYDGSEFFGWQKTSMGPTIEATLQAVLEKILQEPLELQAASRTDRGVHAEEQWINFVTQKKIPHDLTKRLNSLLPPTIRVLKMRHMVEEFHPTLHVEKKTYQYALWIDPIHLPHERHFSWHIPFPLNIEEMRLAGTYFIGEHDFSSFCNARKNLNYLDKKRSIDSLELIFSQQQKLLFMITGIHFLYKMVRNLVGTLVDVGRGKIPSHAIPSILHSGQRASAGITAPAHGLTLKQVCYPQKYMGNS